MCIIDQSLLSNDTDQNSSTIVLYSRSVSTCLCVAVRKRGANISPSSSGFVTSYHCFPYRPLSAGSGGLLALYTTL